MRTRLILFWIFLGAILFWALVKGLLKGGQDFAVFYHAASLAREGKWDLLYLDGPDRYLYAPGFAILLAPLSYLPFHWAHTIWLAVTLVLFGFALRHLSAKSGAWATGLALLFFIRSVTIDIRYAQVNLAILSMAVLAFGHWIQNRHPDRIRTAWLWFGFVFLAISKLYALVLLLFPLTATLFFERDRRPGKMFWVGALLASAVVVLPPLWISPELYFHWYDALVRKGLPMDSHNQSFLAVILRVFSGEKFYALGVPGVELTFSGFLGGRFWSPDVSRFIAGLFAVSIFFCFVFLLVSFVREKTDAKRWTLWSLALALTFLPSHLVWKSYFLMGIPAMAALFKVRPRLVVLSLPTLLILPDGVGYWAAGMFDGWGGFLWTYLVGLGFAGSTLIPSENLSRPL